MSNDVGLKRFLERVLEEVERKNVSFQKAFKRALSSFEGKRLGFDVGRAYKVARSLLVNYYCLSSLAGSKKSLIEEGLRRVGELERGISPCKGVRGLSYKYSFPEWFVRRLLEIENEGFVEGLLRALNEEVIWIRVNTLKADVDKTVRLLEEEGAELEVDRDLHYVFRVKSGWERIRGSEVFKEMKALRQDKASCLVVEALRPEVGDRILDACSAPGLKTSLIQALTENRARIIAVDLSKRRLESQKRLMKVLGVKNVELVLADSRKIHMRERADKVLIDAPCTSSGSIARDPAVKVHLRRRGKVDYYSRVQVELVHALCRLGKEVIYATCSVLPEEGEEVILAVLKREAAGVEEVPLRLSPGYREYAFRSKVRRSFPHVDLA